MFQPESEGLENKLFWVALVLALLLHLSLAKGAKSYQIKAQQEVRVEMAIYEPPPPPEPELEQEPEVIEPEPEPEIKPPPAKEKAPPPPKDFEPPPSNAPAETDEKPPVIATGISMNSTVEGNSGFKVRQGNTVYGDVNKENFTDPSKLKGYKTDPSKEFKPVRAAQISKEARVIKEFKVKYPRALLEEGIQGTVVLELQVSKDGRVKGTKLIKGVHPTLDKLARYAMKKTRFKPAEINGNPVDSILTYRYKWEIIE